MSHSRAKVRVTPVNLFLLVFITASPFTGFGQPFLEVTNFPGLFAGPLDWGDFDNDGRLDLFAAGWHVVSDGGWVPRTRIYRNLGGTFGELSGTGLPDVRDANGVVGDYNNDGNVDVLLSGQGSAFVLNAFRNSGAGSFSAVSGLGPTMAFNVTWGDTDNDGDLDVSARNYLIQGSPSDFFRNAGNDSFVSVGDPLPPNLKAASWCDYDQDGFGDLLATDNPGSANVRRLFHNNRDGTFTDIGASFAPGGSTAWGDFDNDGDPDLLISSDSGNQIYRNDGSNILSAVTLGLPASPAGSAIFGDFDNNGWLDVLVMGTTGGPTPVTKLFLNQNGTSFTDSGLTLPGAGGPIRCADFDNDGDLDFAFTGTTTVAGLDPVFKVFRNDIVTKNPRPNPPTGLSVVITNQSTSLTLSWNATFDTNQSGGHTYNLRLGTQPGAGDLFDPTAETNGFRRLVAPGNCGGRRSRTFTNFSGGVYYWSVQAIDHSCVGSPFAAEASFMLAKPTISDIPDQVLFPHIANSIPFRVTAVGTPTDTLTITAIAADGALIPTNGFAFSGSGTNRTLIVTPPATLRGTTTITVTATDTNGATASDSFLAEVRHVFTGSNTSFPAGSTVWGDFNNDGFLDALSVSSPLRLYRNNGNGSFVEVPAGLPPNLSGDAAWGDYNSDGNLDLALIGWTGSNSITVIYRNNGDGTFTDIQAGLPGLNGSVAWGDFDNDGDSDLLVPGATIYRNDEGIFTAAETGLPSAGFGREPWGDYNRDGYLDLLLGTSVFRNNGNGTFSDIGASIEGVFGGATRWGDYDSDGYLDVAIIGFNGPGPDNRVTEVYRNNRDDTFTDINAGLVPLSNSGLAWGDFDNDGRLDLVITGTTNYIGSTWLPALAYHNNGDGTFDTNFVEFYGGFGDIQWIDYDSDGALDLLAPWGDVYLQLFHNETPKKNMPPVTPNGLASLLLSNNDVRLVWSASTDSETTNSAGLNYNLRVGTTPGGIEIMSPGSDLASGRRRLAQRGNASSTDSWLLRDLPVGTYYWSVQAIDSGFVGSAFATEATFTVTNARPTISGIATQTISHSILSPLISFLVGDIETDPSALTVAAVSSNTNRIPNDQIFLSGSGSNRFVQLRSITNQIGAVAITLTVTDEAGWTRSSGFIVNVTNLPPYVAGTSNINVSPDAAVPAIPFQISDAESAPDELSLTVSSSNTNLVANINLFLSGSGSNRFLQIIPTPGVKGLSTIRLVVTDSLGASATNSFVLRIGAFQLMGSGLPDVQQGAVDWGDFDNDGDLDVLICGRLPNGTAITRVYRNNGDSSFSDIGAGLPGISSTLPPTAAWSDLDRDGHLDFVLAGGGTTRIYRNNANGTFSDIAAGLPTSASASWADCDNDGDLDIVLAAGPFTVSAQPTRIYLNNGNLTFSNSNVILPQASFIAPADFDNDGDVDFALGGVFDKQVIVTALVRNEGGGIFTTSLSSGLQGVSAGSWSWNDYNQDGRLDLLMTGINGNNYFTLLYRNHTNDTFSLVATNLSGINSGTAIWGDYDNDGRADIFLTGLTPGRDGGRVAKIFHNDSGEVFTDTGEPLAGTHWSAAAPADYNGDGRLDLLYCGTTNGLTGGPATMLFRNNSTASNSPPSPPTGLTVLPGAILTWNPSSDLETTNTGGLTYNLRIGTNSGGVQIMSPHADPATGWRRVARIGNTGASTRWRANLPPGTYYWSVQAIDAAFAGSPFAAESSFTIPSQPPRITGGSFVNPGQFKLTFDAMPGAGCRVLISQDLVTWTIAGAATEISPGHFEFVDSMAINGSRFYRVSSQ